MKIAIAGGSISGLAAALTLNCTGHDVLVYERSAHALRGQGGGVVVLRRMLRFLENHGHYCRDMISVPTHRRRWIDVDGSVTHDEPEMLPFSSWDAVYRSLCNMLPPERIRYGREVTGFDQDEHGVDLHFDDGQTERADVLIAADGTGSRLRALLFPDYHASFSGYIAWRASAFHLLARVDNARCGSGWLARIGNGRRADHPQSYCLGPGAWACTCYLPV
jgi:2-polyprenyl-6-methoxyphenol hydroxylase-like FAD-dependent oxidoreductase